MIRTTIYGAAILILTCAHGPSRPPQSSPPHQASSEHDTEALNALEEAAKPDVTSARFKQILKQTPNHSDALAETVLALCCYYVDEDANVEFFERRQREKLASLYDKCPAAFVNARIEKKRDGTMFDYACRMGHLSLAKFLDHKGLADKEALFSVRDFSILRYLVAKGYDINSRDENGYSGAAHAIFIGKPGIAQYLINHHADLLTTNNDGDGLMHLLTSVDWPSPEAFFNEASILRKHGVPIDQVNGKGGTTPLGLAIQNNPKIVSALMKLGADPRIQDSLGDNPLNGICTGHHHIHGIELRQLIGSSPLIKEAINHPNDEGIPVLSELVSHDPPVDEVHACLAAGADVNQADKQRRTPIMHAAKDDPAVLFELLSFQPNLTILDNRGRSILHYVMESYNEHLAGTTATAVRLVTMLCRMGAPVSTKDRSGETALDIGKQWKVDEEVLDVLREHGATRKG